VITTTTVAQVNRLITRVTRPSAIRTTFSKRPGIATVVATPDRTITLTRPAAQPFVGVTGPASIDLYLVPRPQVIQVTQVTTGLTGRPGADGAGGSGTLPPTSPEFTWSDGRLTAVDYADGSTKALTYTDDRLSRIDFARPGRPGVRKDFSYNPDGTLAAVAQSNF